MAGRNEFKNSGNSQESKLADEVTYEIPDWAGRPPSGFHLDVTKNDKLIQKLMIDEKRSYYFGRNPKLCDFSVDHASCSRVHAVLLFHKHLKRFFLVDLGSSHGTFIGNTRLEVEKPQFLELADTFHFGASTRRYVLRIRLGGNGRKGDDITGQDISLPEKEEELENLTEYNTALNRRITVITIPDENANMRRPKHKNNVNFADDDEIINPEDIDPTVGRFRNLIATAVIPNKRSRLRSNSDVCNLFSELSNSSVARQHNRNSTTIHQRSAQDLQKHLGPIGFGPISTKLGLSMPNSAPDVDLYADSDVSLSTKSVFGTNPLELEGDVDQPQKKKYAKEAWPGKKGQATHLLG